MDRMSEKLEKLKNWIRPFGRVLVAYSGGVDSALVAKVSRLVLGKENVLAVTAQSESLAPSELEDSKRLAREMDVTQKIVLTQEMQNPDYVANPENRCYFCKTELYNHLVPIARELGYSVIFDGTNIDDLGDDRPGLTAAREHGVKSPLVEAGLTKQEIRELSKSLGLPTWDKPELACLSSRIPHGTLVTIEKLGEVDKIENILRSFGFKQVRARHLGERIRIEVEPELVSKLKENSVLVPVTEKIFELGFKEVEIAEEGYRRGKKEKLHPIE